MKTSNVNLIKTKFNDPLTPSKTKSESEEIKEQAKRTTNKRQASKKKFAFTFTWAEWALTNLRVLSCQVMSGNIKVEDGVRCE